MKQRARWVAAAIMMVVPGLAAAQQPGNAADPWCNDGSDSGRARYCEVREFSLVPPGAPLRIDATPNGSIKLTGWNRREVLVRAKVVATADTDDAAQTLAREVNVRTDGAIRSEGPASRGRTNWSVSFDVSVPFDLATSLSTVNGSLAITGMHTQADFRTQNGSVTLTDVGGQVRGRTQNGSLRITLAGTRWEGEGLDVETQNGSVRFVLPDGYAAHLETGTVNGRVACEFPVTVTGRVDRRQLTSDLNGGGPTLRATTVNGSVSITKR